MDRLVQILFVSDSRVTRREICNLGVLQIAPDGVSVAQNEYRPERRLRIWGTMTRKVCPLFFPSSSTTLEM